MPNRMKLTDRIFTKTSCDTVLCHLLEPGIEVKALKNIYTKFNRRAHELGIEVKFFYQLVKQSTDHSTQCTTYKLISDSGRLAERSTDDLIQWSIGLSTEDHAKWEAAKLNISTKKNPIESWVFEYDPLRDLYVLKAEGYSMRDLATAFKKRESRPELAGKIKFVYDPIAVIITLTPQEHVVWENYCDQIRTSKNRPSKKRKAFTPVDPLERPFSLTKNGLYYKHKITPPEKPSSVASVLNARARALDLDKKIVKFIGRKEKKAVVISPEGFNLWRPYTKQRLDSDPVVSIIKLKPIRLCDRPFSIDEDNQLYTHTPTQGTDVYRLVLGFNLKAKGLRLDLNVVKFTLNSEKNICISSAGYQIWVDSFPRQKQKPIPAKDRVFTSSKDGTYYEHFTDADLYIVARDINFVVAKLRLSDEVRFEPNFQNGSVMISNAGYQEWSSAMVNYRNYTYTATNDNNSNNRDNSINIDLSEQDLIDLENELALNDTYDFAYELNDNANSNEFTISESIEPMETANYENSGAPFVHLTPWSPNYYGPSGLFSPSRHSPVQTTDYSNLNCNDTFIPKND